MSTNQKFQAGELTRGQIQLIDWVGDKLGQEQQAGVITDIKYGVLNNSQSSIFQRFEEHLGGLVADKIQNAGVKLIYAGCVAMPVAVLSFLAGAGGAAFLAASAVGATLASVGYAVSNFSDDIGDRIASRRIKNAIADNTPSLSSPKISQ